MWSALPHSESIAQEELRRSFQERHNNVELVDDGILLVVVGYTAAARFASNEFVLPPLIEICHKIRPRRAHTHKCSYKAAAEKSHNNRVNITCYFNYRHNVEDSVIKFPFSSFC